MVRRDVLVFLLYVVLFSTNNDLYRLLVLVVKFVRSYVMESNV